MSAQAARSQGSARIPSHYEAELLPVSFPGPLVIGKIPGGFATHLLVIEVTTAFDGSATMTVGDDVAQGHLATIADIFLDQVGIYGIEVTHAYTALSEIKAYVSGSPTVGQANIFLFYQ